MTTLFRIVYMILCFVKLANTQAQCGGPSIRLMGGLSNRDGRVELFHEGRWKSLCHSGWDNNAAEVVCRELGFAGGVPQAWAASPASFEVAVTLPPNGNCHVNERGCIVNGTNGIPPRLHTMCLMQILQSGTLNATQFGTNDKALLIIGSETYSGNNRPSDLYVDAGTSISWYTTSTQFGIGFEVCLTPDGVASLPILPFSMQCSGTENFLSECAFSAAACGSQTEAAVLCSIPEAYSSREDDTTSPTSVPTTSFPTSSPGSSSPSTFSPTSIPTSLSPTAHPIAIVTESPSTFPTELPIRLPTSFPTSYPTNRPTSTNHPSTSPSAVPTSTPTTILSTIEAIVEPYEQHCVSKIDRCRFQPFCAEYASTYHDELMIAYGSSQLDTFQQRCMPSCLLDPHADGLYDMPDICAAPVDTVLSHLDGRLNWIDYDIAIFSNYSNCSQIEALDLSSHQMVDVGFSDSLNESLPGLTRIDLSDNNFTECPDLTAFNSRNDRLTIDLSGNEITNCPRGAFCGLKLQELDLSYNNLGAATDGVIRIGDWFSCDSNRARKRRQSTLGFSKVINLVGNRELSFIADAASLANFVDALAVADSNITDLYAIPGNCRWEQLYFGSSITLEINTGFVGGVFAVDGGTYNQSCIGNIRYRIGLLPDCIGFDSVSAQLTVGICSEEELLQLRRNLTVTRYDLLDDTKSETATFVYVIVYDIIQVVQTSKATLVTGQNYSSPPFYSDTFQLTAGPVVTGGCELEFFCSGCEDHSGLGINSSTGALYFHGVLTEPPGTSVVAVLVNDSCTSAVNQVDAVTISRYAPLNMFWESIPSTFSTQQVDVGQRHARHTHGMTVEYGAPLSDWSFHSNANRDPLEYLNYVGVNFPEGLNIEKRIGGLSNVVISGVPFSYGVWDISIFADEIHGVSDKKVVRTPVYIKNGSSTVSTTFRITVVECLDYGRACNFIGSCHDSDGDPFDGRFTCIESDGNGTFATTNEDNLSSASTVAAATITCLLILLLIIGLFLVYRNEKRREVAPWKPPPPDRYEIDPADLDYNLKVELGSGQFGVVYKGVYKAKVKQGRKAAELVVAVKQCSSNSQTMEQRNEFLAEGNLMKRFNHNKIVRLIGVVTQSDPMLLVTEYMALGDLQAYLAKIRTGESQENLKSKDLLQFSLDIVEGLLYLSQNNFVHRDVATRNMLVSHQKAIKISDFGLSRKIYGGKEFYQQGGISMLPVRWMAPECLTDGRFTAASDVWSLGICVWEIFSGGVIPYAPLSNAQILDEIINGTRLNRPNLMPTSVYGTCFDCWSFDHNERPDHSEVQLILEAAMQDPLLSEEIVIFGPDTGLSYVDIDDSRRSSQFGPQLNPRRCSVVSADKEDLRELYNNEGEPTRSPSAFSRPPKSALAVEHEYIPIKQQKMETTLYDARGELRSERALRRNSLSELVVNDQYDILESPGASVRSGFAQGMYQQIADDANNATLSTNCERNPVPNVFGLLAAKPHHTPISTASSLLDISQERLLVSSASGNPVFYRVGSEDAAFEVPDIDSQNSNLSTDASTEGDDTSSDENFIEPHGTMKNRMSNVIMSSSSSVGSRNSGHNLCRSSGSVFPYPRTPPAPRSPAPAAEIALDASLRSARNVVPSPFSHGAESSTPSRRKPVISARSRKPPPGPIAVEGRKRRNSFDKI